MNSVIFKSTKDRSLFLYIAPSTIIFLLLLYMVGCESSRIKITDRSRIHVSSLQIIWPQLIAKSLSWHPDAYLTEIVMPINVNGATESKIPLEAFFLSASESQDMLIVMLNQNDGITTTIRPLKKHLSDKPILRSDWQVDSTTALMSLLNDKDVMFLISSSANQCSNLTLERKPDIPTDPVVWDLSIYGCGISDYDRYEYLDPITGEIIK